MTYTALLNLAGIMALYECTFVVFVFMW